MRQYLAKLLGILAGVSSWGVDKGDNGEPKVVGVFHKAQRLAVAVGLRHAKVAVDVLLHSACHMFSASHASYNTFSFNTAYVSDTTFTMITAQLYNDRHHDKGATDLRDCQQLLA